MKTQARLLLSEYHNHQESKFGIKNKDYWKNKFDMFFREVWFSNPEWRQSFLDDNGDMNYITYKSYIWEMTNEELVNLLGAYLS